MGYPMVMVRPGLHRVPATDPEPTARTFIWKVATSPRAASDSPLHRADRPRSALRHRACLRLRVVAVRQPHQPGDRCLRWRDRLLRQPCELLWLRAGQHLHLLLHRRRGCPGDVPGDDRERRVAAIASWRRPREPACSRLSCYDGPSEVARAVTGCVGARSARRRSCAGRRTARRSPRRSVARRGS